MPGPGPAPFPPPAVPPWACSFPSWCGTQGHLFHLPLPKWPRWPLEVSSQPAFPGAAGPKQQRSGLRAMGSQCQAFIESPRHARRSTKYYGGGVSKIESPGMYSFVRETALIQSSLDEGCRRRTHTASQASCSFPAGPAALLWREGGRAVFLVKLWRPIPSSTWAEWELRGQCTQPGSHCLLDLGPCQSTKRI